MLDDLLPAFDATVRDADAEILWTYPSYKIDHWNPKLYDHLLTHHQRAVFDIVNLTFELTRAANRVCEYVRDTLDAGFRLSEGALLLAFRPSSDLPPETRRPEYNGPRQL